MQQFFRNIVNRSAKKHLISTQEDELLLCLTRQPVDAYFFQVWEPVAGSVEAWISDFVMRGLLEEATPVYKLPSLGLQTLRDLCRQHGLKVSGTKAELAALLGTVLSSEELFRLTSTICLYQPTQLLQQRLSTYESERKASRELMEQAAFDFLFQGNISQAKLVVRSYINQYESHHLQGTAIEYNVLTGTTTSHQHKIDVSSETEPAVLWLLHNPLTEISYSQDIRRRIAAYLAMRYLVGTSFDSVKHILQLTQNTFTCSDLTSFLAHPHGGYVTKVDPNNPHHLVDLYVHTKLSEVYGKTEKERLIAQNVGKGIQIISVEGQKCSVCDTGKHFFHWSELQQLPLIPRHWGCRCVYASWI